MINKSPKKRRQISTPILIATISLLGVCITTIGAIIVGVFPNIINVFESNPNKAEAVTFRVTEVSGVSVPKAKVILLSGNDIHIQYTDSNGGSVFNIIKTETLRVFVETDQYEIHDQIFSSNTPNPIEIRLKPKDVSRKSVIVRVIDNKDDLPINGAEVILVTNGNIYSQITDSNGITKFTTSFPTDEIDGDISVSISGFKAEYQRMTLQADRIQDIRLDKTTGILTVGFTGQVKEIAQNPEVNNETIDPDVDGEDTYNCSNKSLSPEEKENCGQHLYMIESNMVAGNCYYILDDGSHAQSITFQQTHINIFESETVMEIIENNTVISTWTSLNTYKYEDAESTSSVSFTLNGFTGEYFDGSCKIFTKANIIK